MGRPRKAQGETKTAVLYIRQKPDKRAALDARAAIAGLEPTEYARQYLEGARFTYKPTTEQATDAQLGDILITLDNLLTQTKRIGNNVNQLAHSVNAGAQASAYWEDVGQELKSHLADIEALMEDVSTRL